MRKRNLESRNYAFLPEPTRIALLIERLVGFNYEALKGIRDAGTHRHNWNCQFIDPKVEHISIIREWKPDGIIAFVSETRLAEELEALSVPVVDIAAWTAKPRFPRFSVNDREVGALAAETMFDLGVESFGFVGNTRLRFGELRREGYVHALGVQGYSCHEWHAQDPMLPTLRAWTMGKIDKQLVGWLKSLPKPIGIFADNDERALLLSECCLDAGIDVPNEVLLLGVDNDPHLTEFGVPNLSSIEIPARRIGSLAAEHLSRLMAGFEYERVEHLLSPVGVVHRQSTDRFCQSEPALRDALAYIRDHACQGAGVQDIVSHCSVSRRTLENLFRRHLRTSPLQEIVDTRLAAAKRMLSTGSEKVDVVARDCGFASASALCNAFRSRLDTTPQAYRRGERASH
jgi:LacI family transcriptional regulator